MGFLKVLRAADPITLACASWLIQGMHRKVEVVCASPVGLPSKGNLVGRQLIAQSGNTACDKHSARHSGAGDNAGCGQHASEESRGAV